MSAVVINTYYPGIIGGRVAHTEKQTITIPMPDGKFLTKTITHSDRALQPCVRVTNITEEVLNIWQFGECPYWENPKRWQGYNKEKKIVSYVARFDDGFGVDFKIT